MTTAPTPAAPDAPLKGVTVLVLALLTAIAPLATDMYLPAFPTMADELSTSAAGIQLTLTTFLVGLALGQLVIGPVSDQFGRRGLLVAGTVVCALSGVGAALAPSVGVLVVLRFVQGFSGAAGIVLARAVVADRASGDQAAKLFSLMMVIGGVAPVAGPLLGGGLIGLVGWRGVFWVLTAICVVMVVGALAAVPESLPAEQRHSGGLRATARGARAVLGNRLFVGYTLTFAFAFAAMFAYISASSFVLQNVLGLSTGQYAVAFAVNALAIAVVSGVSAGLVGKVRPAALMLLGVVVLVTASLALVVVVFVAGTPRWPTLAVLFVAIGSLGLIFGNATSLATAQAPGNAGTASAVLGALQFGLGALASPLVGLAGESDARPMAVVMSAVAVLSLLSALLLTRRPHAVPGARLPGQGGEADVPAHQSSWEA